MLPEAHDRSLPELPLDLTDGAFDRLEALVLVGDHLF
jgi:hypothetical protein